MTTQFLKTYSHTLNNQNFKETSDNLVKIKDEKLRNRLISHWTCQFGFEELVVSRYPEPPQQLINYRALNFNQKAKVDSNFWQRKDIMAYLEDKKYKESINLRNLWWLKTILEWLKPGEDQEQMIMIRKRIQQFETFFTLNPILANHTDKKPGIQERAENERN